LLTAIVSKYKSNESFSKRIITSYDEGTDDIMMEEDEVMLEFNQGKENAEVKESNIFAFVKSIIEEIATVEL
jgi:hypothetical protein